MREYRKRKHAAHMSDTAEGVPSPSIEDARDPWSSIMRNPGPQTKAPDGKLAPQRAVSTFKTASELARPFPLGARASQVCPYCYNSGYSSPGTRCSYLSK